MTFVICFVSLFILVIMNELKTIKKTDNELVVANHIVLFGGTDLDGERFTKSTMFESDYTATGRLYVDWEHGLDDDKAAPKSNNVLGYVDWSTAKVDEKGLWVQRVLNRRNQYMQYIEPLIDAGLIGNSSEAVPSLVQKTKDGEITQWGLRRDTLTVNPAEPRMMTENVVSAIKSLSDIFPNLKALIPESGVAVSDSAKDEEARTDKNNENIGVVTMTDNVTLTKEQFDELLAGRSPEKEAVSAKNEMADFSARMDALLDKIEKSAPAKDGGYISPDSEDRDRKENKSFGDYLVAVRRGNFKRLKNVYGVMSEADFDAGEGYAKTALAESAGVTGGYTVPTEFGGRLNEVMKDFNALRQAGALVQPMSARTKEYFTLDLETAPTAGNTAYAGGVIAYWTEEAGAITESEPKFRRILLEAHKAAGLALASNEIREDSAETIDGLLFRCFGMALGSLEEYAFFRGDGVGKPLGILNSGALKSQTRSAASAVAIADVAKLMSGMIPTAWKTGAFFINPTVIEKLIQLVSDPISWAQNLRDGFPMTLLGRPIYPVGCLPALNTAGDILFVDPTYYVIGDRSVPTLGYSEHYKFANDQGAWRVTARVDGQPTVDNTITLEDASTTVSPFVCLAAGT
jgi:HK97 family phage major capsid protein